MHRRAEFLLLAAGWGANHFSTLLVVYRRDLGLSPSLLGLLFGVYALGLVPGLIVAGRVSDARGRKAVVLPASFVAIVASAVLAFGARGFVVLLAGRLLYGIAMGSVMSPGSVWVQELSTAESGPRRATLALSAGFGLGPLAAGMVAQFAPLPMVLPYVVHAALMGVAIALARVVPETAKPAPASRPNATGLGRRELALLAELLPAAPWAFGFAAISMAILPGLMRAHVARPVLYSAFVIVLTLASGVSVQPLTSRLGRYGDKVGLGLGALGVALAARAVAVGSPALAFPVGVLVGAGYGLVMTTGLREVAARVSAAQRGTVVGIYYVLTYLGFALPFVHAVMAERWGDAGSLYVISLASVACFVIRVFIARAPQPAIVSSSRLVSLRRSTPGARDAKPRG